MDIILASTSPYRERLLQRLQLPFRCVAPTCDETALPNESPEGIASRLALCKAQSVATTYPAALVIGSDQVAAINGQIMGKPGGFEAARAQLMASSGNTVHFYTAVSVLALEQQFQASHTEPFSAHFRSLSETQIARYLERERPYDCAGSFKVEGLGIALFERLEGADPSSLEGLPMIALTRLLSNAGINIL